MVIRNLLLGCYPFSVYELLGGDTVVLNEFNLYGSNRLGMLTTADTLVCASCTTAVAPSVYLSPVGMKRYELSNHLGNVMTVISDKVTPVDTTNDGLWDYFNPSLVSATDYYPFGMGMPGRNFNSNYYRYGMQGSEKDDELSGVGNHITTFFREGDPRLLIWWTLDPKGHMQPWQSPYSWMNGNPILNNDPLGDCPPCWAAARWLATRAVPLFFGGAAVSAGTQFAGNYIMYDDAKKAASNIDLVDAAADGSINVISGGAGSLRTLFKHGTTVAIRKATAVTVVELVSATTDYTFEGSQFESVFDGDKSLFEAAGSFVLSMGGEYTGDQIKEMFKKWAADDMIPSNFAPKTGEEKDLVRKMNKLVNSDVFQGGADKGVTVMENYVDAVLGSGVKMEVKKVEEKGDFEMPRDNTSVAPTVIRK